MGIVWVIGASFLFQAGAAIQAFRLGRFLPGRWAWWALSLGLAAHLVRRLLLVGFLAGMGSMVPPSLAMESIGLVGSLLLMVGLWKMGSFFEEDFRLREQLAREAVQGQGLEERAARQLAEEQRAVAGHRLQMATRAARLGIWEWNKAERHLIWDDMIREHYGLGDDGAPKDLEAWVACVHAEDQAAFRQAFAAAQRGDEELDLHFRALLPGGEVRHFRIVGQVLRDGGGRVLRLIGVNQDISRRVEAQEALVQTEQRFRTLFESMSEGVALHELLRDDSGTAYDYRILDVNPAYSRHTGVPAAKALNMLGSKVYGATPPFFLDVFERVARTGEPEDLEAHFPPSHRHFHISVFSPALGRFAVVFEDITKRKQAEEALQEGERRMRVLIEKAPIAIVLSRDGQIVDANPRYLQMHGYDPHEAVAGLPITRHLATRDAASVVDRAWQREHGDHGDRPYEVMGRRKDGSEFPEMVAAARVELADGPASVVFIQDISERKRAEAAILASQEKLQLLLDSTAEGIYGVDTAGDCTFCNPASVRMLGFSGAEELLGKNMHVLIHHTRKDGTPFDVAQCRIYQAFKEGVGVHVEDEVFWRADGTWFPVEYWSYPQRAGSEVVGAVVGFLDRSEREAWEAEIRRLSQFLESVIQHADVWMNVLDNESNVVLWNQAAERISGYSQAEVLGNARIWNWLYPDPDYLASIGEKVAAILRMQEQVQGFETTIRTKGGDTRVVSWNSRALVDASGVATGSIAIGRDVTEAKMAEDQLKVAEARREDLLGELAAKNKELETVVYVASHDLRSPLVNILGFTQRLEKAFADVEALLGAAEGETLRRELEPILKERVPPALRFIRASGTKMDGLINGLLRISRAGRVELNPTHLDMNGMVRGILDAMAFQIQKAEAVVVTGSLPPCFGDESQVNQVFSNLLDNAIKYRDPVRPLHVTIAGEVQNGLAVYGVEDTGLGIPAGSLEKVWTLFHRLEPGDDAGGEGLGLALVQRMVERNGGRAWAESEPGRGSRFFVALPTP